MNDKLLGVVSRLVASGLIHHANWCRYTLLLTDYSKGHGPAPNETQEECDCGVFDLLVLLENDAW